MTPWWLKPHELGQIQPWARDASTLDPEETHRGPHRWDPMPPTDEEAVCPLCHQPTLLVVHYDAPDGMCYIRYIHRWRPDPIVGVKYSSRRDSCFAESGCQPQRMRVARKTQPQNVSVRRFHSRFRTHEYDHGTLFNPEREED